jgi:hypothetical protein
MISPSDEAMQRRLDDAARRSAAKLGIIARRARGRKFNGVPLPNGFRLLDAEGNCIAGEDYSLSAEDVIEFCRQVP